MAKEESWQVGEEVMVRWEGSRKYLKAKIRSLKSHKCTVEFGDGTQKIVEQQELKRVEQSVMTQRKSGIVQKKTPSPTRRGRSRTPPRRASLGRGRGRGNTPSSPEKKVGRVRTPPVRSPSRSPSRTGRSPARKFPDTPPTPRRGKKSPTSLPLKELEVSLEKVDLPFGSTGRRYPSRRHVVPFDREASESSKLFQVEEKIKEVKPSSHLPSSAAKAPSSSLPVVVVSSKAPRGATILSILVIVLQAVVPLFLYLACTKNKGMLFAVPPVPKRVQSYFSLKAAGVYLGWLAFQALLMLVPLGKTPFQPAGGQQRLQYRMNGLVSMFVTTGTLAGMAYYQVPLSYFNENIIRMIVTSFSFAFLSSVLVYIQSFFATDSILASNTGNYLYDFLVGRELNPRLWRHHFDLKLFVFRLGFLGMATVDALLLYKYFVIHGCVSHQMAAVASMQLLYVMDNFWREETLLATFSFRYQGVGYGLLVSFLTFLPFVYTLPVLYLASSVSTRQQPWYCLASAATLFLCGLYVNRKSLSDKYAFKSNPYNLALSHLSTIPSDYTRQLISSGLWGVVRHPNYLGEILMFLAWTLPCGFTSAVPYVPFVTTAAGLVVRSYVVEGSMRRRHGQAWVQYVARVRHRFLPYVF